MATKTTAEMVAAGGFWAGPGDWREGTTSAEVVVEALRTAQRVDEGEDGGAFWIDYRFEDGSIARHYSRTQSERWEVRCIRCN